MKVLHILNELKFSGAEIMYQSASEEFQKLGCELYVVNTSPNLGEYTPFFEKAGYQILHWPFNISSFKSQIQYIKKAINYLEKERIDIVHIHSSSMRLLMSFCAWRANCKSVYTFHSMFTSNWYSYFYHILQRWVCKNIFKCTFQTISDSVYLNEKNIYKNKTRKIYNWYNSNSFYPASFEEKKLVREKLGIPSDTLVIISVGGCSPIKRHSDIIKALPLIIEAFPNVLYLHLGKGDALKSELTLAEDLNVEKYIRFEGNKSNVRKYLMVSDIYIMPSKHEGISITTIEALACKIPSVLYNVPGLKDFNKHLECSILIDEDYKQLALAVTQLYIDREKQSTLKVNAKKFVDENFLMKTNVQKIYNLYCE